MPGQPQLTTEQREALCAEHIDWATSYLRARIGPQAEEFAGIGLFEATQKFDPARGVPFRAFLATVICRVAIRELKKLGQWTGGKGYEQMKGSVEVQDYDLSDDTLPGDASEQDEQVNKQVGHVDAIENRDERTQKFARFMGHFRKTDFRRTKVWFESTTDLIDAVMLFGARMYPANRESSKAIIIVDRSVRYWASLWWIVHLLENHEIRMHKRSGARLVRTRLIFNSRGNRLFVQPMRRWYPQPKNRQASTPAELNLTEPLVATWLVDALAKHRVRRHKTLQLTAPRIGEATAVRMLREFQALTGCDGAALQSSGETYRIAVPESQIQQVSEWTSQFVPPAAWMSDQRVYG